MRKPITALTVTYVDGSVATWAGHGSCDEFRTPTEARGAPILRDSDMSVVQIVLVHPREPAEPAAVTS